jgi:diguanylate cyclase (GGDEF)-like protein
MWVLIIRSPSSAPIEYKVKEGKNTLGRKPDNDIVILDESASRFHAEIYCQNELAVINDLGSTNGTYVNREKISKPHVFQTGDQVRVGQCVISASFQKNGDTPALVLALSGTRPLTRDLLLESIDQHAVLLDVVSSRLTMIFDLETALKEITEMTQQAMGADKAGVILANNFEKLDDLGLPGSFTRQALEMQSVVIDPDLNANADNTDGSKGQHKIYSALCVPVKSEQEIVALLYAYKTDPAARPFSQHDVQLAVAISHQTAMTIQREKMLKESQVLEQLATTDSLTGLHNRRQILNLAEFEFQRSQRFNHPLTLLVLDLDDLKTLNDNHGHLVGDKALIHLAGNCSKQIRNEDYIGRLGGDEFVILLIETTKEIGSIVAERIRQSCCDMKIETQAGPVSFSVSIGVATSNKKTSNLTDLLDKADAGMRKAKKAGKNQIAVGD